MAKPVERRSVMSGDQVFIDKAKTNDAPNQAWNALAALVDHPVYNTAQIAPGFNIPANALAYVSHMQRGDTEQAMWDSAGLIPGVRGIGMAEKAIPRLAEMGKDWGSTVYNLAKNYPSAIVRSDPRTAVRMTGRQVGNGMQIKQGAEAMISPANATVNYLNQPDH